MSVNTCTQVVPFESGQHTDGCVWPATDEERSSKCLSARQLAGFACEIKQETLMLCSSHKAACFQQKTLAVRDIRAPKRSQSRLVIVLLHAEHLLNS